MSAAADAYTLNGYAFSGFYDDANGNGKKDRGEVETNNVYIQDGAGYVQVKALDVTSIEPADGLRLVAEYAAPGIEEGKTGTGSSAVPASEVAQYAAGTTLKVNITATGIQDNSYSVSVAGPNGAIRDIPLNVTKDEDGDPKGFNIENVELTFAADGAVTGASVATSDTTATVTAPKAAWAAGDYTFTLKDLTKNVDLEAATVKIAAITLDGNGGVFKTAEEQTDPAVAAQYAPSVTMYAAQGATYETVFNSLAKESEVGTPDADNSVIAVPYGKTSATATNYTVGINGSNKAFQGFRIGTTTVTGTYTANSTTIAGLATQKVKDGDKLVADYDVAEVQKLEYEPKNDANGNDLKVTTGDVTTGKATFSYNGTELGTADISGNVATYSFGSATPALGEYTVTVTTGSGSTLETVGAAKTTLVKVAFDAGDGKWKADGGVSQKPADVILNLGDKINKTSLEEKAVNLDAPDTYAFDAWTVGGEKISYAKDGGVDKWAVPAGTDNVVTLTATYKLATVALPTASYENGYLKLASDAGDAYRIVYATTDPGNATTLTGTAYDKAGSGVKVDAAAASPVTIYAQVQPIASQNASLGQSGIATFTSYNVPSTGALAIFDAFAKSALGEPTAASTTAKPEYYSTVLTEAKKAGDDAIKAVGYSTEKGWNTAQVAQQKALLSSIADYGKGALAANKAGVANADGSISRISDDAYADAVAAIGDVLADFDTISAEGFNRANANDVAKIKTKAIKEALATVIPNGNAYANAITAAVSGAKTVKVAEAVTDVEALVNAIPAAPAADATDEAKAAYAKAVKDASDAFGRLNEAEQAQVSAASVKALYTATQAQLAAAQAELATAKKDAEDAKAAASDPSKNEALKAAQDKADAAQKAADAAQADADAAKKAIKAAVKATKPAATVKAGKKKLTVKASKGTLEKLGKETYKYRYKKGTKAGGSWKTLKAGKAVTVKKLKKGKKYTVQVKATVDGTAAKTFKKTVKVK